MSNFANTIKLAAIAIPTAFALMATTPAWAVPTTFAQYFQVDGALQQWNVSNTGDTTTVTATGAVYFVFSGVYGLPFSGPQLATLTLTATSTQPGNCGVNCGAGDSFDQFGYSGNFSFTDAASAPGTDLLSGTFAVTGSPSTTGAQLNANIGSSGGGFDASATPGNLSQLVFTSDYLAFLNATNEDASFSLSSLIPPFKVNMTSGDQAYPSGTYTASGTGTFASDPAPVSNIPEPASMALLGVALVGTGLLRRRNAPLDAATKTPSKT